MPLVHVFLYDKILTAILICYGYIKGYTHRKQTILIKHTTITTTAPCTTDNSRLTVRIQGALGRKISENFVVEAFVFGNLRENSGLSYYSNCKRRVGVQSPPENIIIC